MGEEFDDQAFFEAMKDVVRLKDDKRIVRRERGDKHNVIISQSEKNIMDAVLDEKYHIEVSNLPEYIEGQIVGLHPVIMEKLRNGEFSIQKTLDLHGFSVEEGKRLFEEFIKSSVKEGLRCVRTIHGRGLKSKEEPVLKSHLKKWILKAMNRKWVIAFASCKMCDGGPGATYILLRKKPEKKKRIKIIA
ncbi:MAG: Smr/MutS family endonuclease [Syntrophorhabdaceae bacterium]|nr:Smr/MutS family endonuclease [Syntrophorhabdaceae bacterium]